MSNGTYMYDVGHSLVLFNQCNTQLLGKFYRIQADINFQSNSTLMNLNIGYLCPVLT